MNENELVINNHTIHDVSKLVDVLVYYIKERDLNISDYRIMLSSGGVGDVMNYNWVMIDRLKELINTKEVYTFNDNLDKEEDYKLFDYSDRDLDMEKMFGIYIRNFGTYLSVYFYENMKPMTKNQLGNIERISYELPLIVNINNLVDKSERYKIENRIRNDNLFVLNRDAFRRTRDVLK